VARVDLLQTPAQFHLFYNVDAAVGKNAPNRKDDVLLVQYLLKNASTLGFPTVFQWNVLNYPLAGVWDRNWQALLEVYTETEIGPATRWGLTVGWIGRPAAGSEGRCTIASTRSWS